MRRRKPPEAQRTPAGSFRPEMEGERQRRRRPDLRTFWGDVESAIDVPGETDSCSLSEPTEARPGMDMGDEPDGVASAAGAAAPPMATGSDAAGALAVSLALSVRKHAEHNPSLASDPKNPQPAAQSFGASLMKKMAKFCQASLQGLGKVLGA